ncbi:hypothetical protein SAMN05216566_114105 [Aureimonas phyllosphaerae]|uniref:Uncharacterized protein n=1 Tax=Aureimonas phyllosphaerae TaxID=1166078 RepID=A0A7W6BZ01_9HYPH|nr:hypothetical protein [Aureimonas phyllosphaerae]MBB3961697.1 hypothetical protein [Aureimonas phyllosphaerae]SFF45792.1 hypothetical protein SAMN05216566_114105 [Aureimonas phyllosphaerae]
MPIKADEDAVQYGRKWKRSFAAIEYTASADFSACRRELGIFYSAV